MIKNREEVKKEMMIELEKIVDKYINDMNESSNKDKFPIGKIESMMGVIIKDSKQVIMDKTEELLKNIDETEEVYKKKPNMRKRGYF